MGLYDPYDYSLWDGYSDIDEVDASDFTDEEAYLYAVEQDFRNYEEGLKYPEWV